MYACFPNTTEPGPVIDLEIQFASSPEIPRELPGDEENDVLFGTKYGVRTIELNRPKKLNSLNGSMARKILPRLAVRTTNEICGGSTTDDGYRSGRSQD